MREASSPHQEPADDIAYANTDRELWREGGGDGNGMSYYEPSIHVTEQGGIGINVGGTVYVKTLREWHALAGGPISLVSQFDPEQPEKGWHEATPLPEPRIWRLWRWLRIMR